MANEFQEPLGRPQVGAVNYLNSKPLIEGLSDSLAGSLVLDYPSRLAIALAEGKLDVALIPSIEALRAGESYEFVSDACVAAGGPVRSVKVYFRVPPGDVRTLALDEGSRTSAALTQVLLHHKFGVEPETTSLPLGEKINDTNTDAVLLIGDRAMYPVTEPFITVWDLGEEWWNWTGLPFVFAAWAGRRGAAPRDLATLLSSTRDKGVLRIDQISERESARMSLDRSLVHDYLTKNLHFTLGPAERSGLKLFSQLAAQCGLVQKGNDFVFHDPANERKRQEKPSDATSGPRSQQYLVGTR